MTTPTYITHDPALIHRRPIDRHAWDAAWRIATDHPTCTGDDPRTCPHAELEPLLRWPAAQVGTCTVGADWRNPEDDSGCGGKIIPAAMAHRSSVWWYEGRCERCGTEYTVPDYPRPAASAASVPAYTPGGGR